MQFKYGDWVRFKKRGVLHKGQYLCKISKSIGVVNAGGKALCRPINVQLSKLSLVN